MIKSGLGKPQTHKSLYIYIYIYISFFKSIHKPICEHTCIVNSQPNHLVSRDRNNRLTNRSKRNILKLSRLSIKTTMCFLYIQRRGKDPYHLISYQLAYKIGYIRPYMFIYPCLKKRHKVARQKSQKLPKRQNLAFYLFINCSL